MIFLKAIPAGDPNTLVTLANLGSLLRAQGKPQEAIELLTPFEAATREAFKGGETRRLAALLTTLGRSRVALGYDAQRFKLAEANLLEAHPIFINTRGKAHRETLECVEGLVELYTAWDTAEPGQGYDTKAAEWRR